MEGQGLRVVEQRLTRKRLYWRGFENEIQSISLTCLILTSPDMIIQPFRFANPPPSNDRELPLTLH